jgi:hypothetical protein
MEFFDANNKLSVSGEILAELILPTT